MTSRLSCGPRRASLVLALAAGAAASWFAPAPARASGGDSDTTVIQFLASTGADPDATARARWRQDDSSTDFNVELEHLPAGSYDLSVGGVTKGSITVDGTGAGEIEFATPQDGIKPLFDFEVFGQAIAVSQGATVFFDDTFSQAGGGTGTTTTKETIEVFLVSVGPDADAHGRLRYERKSTATRFQVEVEDLAAGTYDIVVDGVVVGQIITTDGAEEVEVEFQDPVEAGKVLLDFDPLGATVSIAQTGTDFLSAVMPASSGSTGVKNPDKGSKNCVDLGKNKGDALLVKLANVGAIAGAQGTATLSRTDSEDELEVEVEDLPPSTNFDLAVGGTVRGVLAVGTDGRAQLTFQDPLGTGDALLDFTVKGALIEVLSGTDVVLSAVFPTNVQAALGKFKKELHGSTHVKLNLRNAGEDLDATGMLTWQLKTNGRETLVIKVKDLPAGSYDVLVDGMLEGDAALVINKPDGSGTVSFDTQPGNSPHKLLLDFPVLDKTVTITPTADNATVLFDAVVQ